MTLFSYQKLQGLQRAIMPLSIAVIIGGSATLLSATVAVGAEQAPDGKAVTDTMHQLGKDVQALLPLIYQYDPQSTLSDKDQINSRIANMLAHAKELAATEETQTDTFQISQQTLVSQLQQAQQAFANGRDAHGISLLRSATSVCATCHTQDEKSASWLMPTSHAEGDSFATAEFLFITRQYEQAFAAYEAWLRQQEALAYDDRTITAFARLMLTALQIQKSPEAITALLAEFSGQDSINPGLAKDLNDWIAGIDELQAMVDINAHPNTDTLEDMADTWLGAGRDEAFGRIFIPESERPRVVWLRGELYRALTRETDSDRIADWLYWLALSDRVLEYRFYYSLSDMYLKQCMLEYTDDPIAPRCYQEYENYIEFFYSGSSGTHIPEEIDAEMKMLKNTVFSNKANRP